MREHGPEGALRAAIVVHSNEISISPCLGLSHLFGRPSPIDDPRVQHEADPLEAGGKHDEKAELSVMTSAVATFRREI